MKTPPLKYKQLRLGKIAVALLVLFGNAVAFSQEYNESGMSFAFATGAGFREIKKINGGAYAQNTTGSAAGIGHDFKYKPLYWSAAWTIKKRQHEFGIEFEKLKYTSLTNATGGVNITYTVNSTLSMTYFNTYYKFQFPIEIKKLTPYVKAGLNFDVYVYDYESKYDDLYGKPGVNTGNSVGLGFSFNLLAGANYYITKNFSAFAEAGYGPVLSKFGIRYTFLKQIMKTD